MSNQMMDNIFKPAFSTNHFLNRSCIHHSHISYIKVWHLPHVYEFFRRGVSFSCHVVLCWGWLSRGSTGVDMLLQVIHLLRWYSTPLVIQLKEDRICLH